MAKDAFDVDIEEEKEEVMEEEEVKEEEVVKDENEGNEENNSNVPEEKTTEVEEVGENPIKNMEFDFDNSTGIIKGKMGDKESKFPIEKMRFSENKKERIALLTPDVVIIKRHYDEDIGPFFCFDGLCCEKLGFPQVRYLFPIVVYNTDSSGTPVDKEVDIKVLQLGNELYDSIMDKHEASGDISNVDLVVSCSDEEYQRVSFTIAGGVNWVKDKEVKKYVYNFWKKNNKYMTMAVGREIDEQEFKQLKGLDNIEDNADVEESFDDVFGS